MELGYILSSIAELSILAGLVVSDWKCYTGIKKWQPCQSAWAYHQYEEQMEIWSIIRFLISSIAILYLRFSAFPPITKAILALCVFLHLLLTFLGDSYLFKYRKEILQLQVNKASA